MRTGNTEPVLSLACVAVVAIEGTHIEGLNMAKGDKKPRKARRIVESPTCENV